MTELTNTNVTGRLIRKYRKEKGWTLSPNPRRGTSLIKAIKDKFGENTCKRLTSREIFKNIESQEPRHVKLTVEELYQVAAALEVPLFALLIDYDDPNATSTLDPSLTTYDLVMQQSEAMKNFRYYDEITAVEETARKFTKRCKNAIKKYTPDEIKENILGGWILENVHVFAKIVDLDMDIIDLNGRGIRATNKTFRYFKEAEEILESIGITVHLPDQNEIDSQRNLHTSVIRNRQNNEFEGQTAQRVNHDTDLLSKLQKLYADELDPDKVQKWQQDIATDLWNLNLDEDAIIDFFDSQEWDTSFLPTREW